MNRWVERLAGLLLRGRHAGDVQLVCNDPALASLPPLLALHSPAFDDRGALLQRHAGPGVGDNLSPELVWQGLPAGASCWALVAEDPDVPLWRPYLHALAFGPASLRRLSEGQLAPRHAPVGVVLAPNGRGERGYLGARPLPGHGPHRYVFQLFALDAMPPDASECADPGPWLRQHALAWGRLDGVYQRDTRGRPITPARYPG
jgi:Raf kinase inhibitor-like YbhB/YbcL family protein